VTPQGPTTDATWLAAAATVVTVTAGDLRGLLGASCQVPAVEHWLVGGATDDGATAHLVLVNPGTTPARVTWTAWAGGGPVDMTFDQVLLAPRSTQVVNLGAPAGLQQALVTHVVASGGQVAAWVQDSAITGITPAGADLVVPGAPPATRQMVPGLLVDGPDAAATLRLLAPGDTGTTARVALFGGTGPVDLPGAASVELSAGTVLDVPLTGLPAGRYTAVVDADVPVVASAAFSRVGQPGALDPVPRTDRALAAATTGGTGTVAIPPGLTATLVVGAVGTATADDGPAGHGTVEVVGTTGKVLVTKTLSVDAGTTGAWQLADLAEGISPDQIAAVRVVAGDGTVLVWAVVVETVQDDGTLIALLTPTPPTGAPVVVTLRDDPTLGQG